MIVRVIPNTRDDQKIEEIKAARRMLEGDEWKEYCYDKICEGVEWLDAFYYASFDGDAVLEKWERYFLDILLDEGKYEYVSDMGEFEEFD